ncbi:MAG: DNA-deoxyinosine glycosylase [Eubacteriales bacterium]|nr:DNA-deoxyinosine glycosylase [Eubacteriales bacterium]
MVHPFEPLYDVESTILILGSLPSVKSREQNFYYGHPQNRFWKVIAAVFAENAGTALREVWVPQTIEEKKEFLRRNHIALWDVIYSCHIHGSSDASIKDVTATDISIILNNSKVKRVFTNGQTAYRLYQKNQLLTTGIEAGLLPSTSPANAAWSLERLVEAWREIINPLAWREIINPLDNI